MMTEIMGKNDTLCGNMSIIKKVCILKIHHKYDVFGPNTWALSLRGKTSNLHNSEHSINRELFDTVNHVLAMTYQ